MEIRKLKKNIALDNYGNPYFTEDTCSDILPEQLVKVVHIPMPIQHFDSMYLIFTMDGRLLFETDKDWEWTEDRYEMSYEERKAFLLMSQKMYENYKR